MDRFINPLDFLRLLNLNNLQMADVSLDDLIKKDKEQYKVNKGNKVPNKISRNSTIRSSLPESSKTIRIGLRTPTAPRTNNGPLRASSSRNSSRAIVPTSAKIVSSVSSEARSSVVLRDRRGRSDPPARVNRERWKGRSNSGPCE